MQRATFILLSVAALRGVLSRRVKADLAQATGQLSKSTKVSWVYADPGDAASNEKAQKSTWPTTGENKCGGTEQSPIDVITEEAKTDPSMLPLETHLTTGVDFVKTTSHSWQLFRTSHEKHQFSTEDEVDEIGGEAKGYTMVGNTKYNFYQVHWHTPAEHLINGKEFKLEAHFVHQLDDPKVRGTLNKLMVIALMYRLGEKCDPDLDKFWSLFKPQKGFAAWNGTDFNFDAYLAEYEHDGYYSWKGSLTTPPCTEGVLWHLLKKQATVCPRQVEAYAKALGALESQKNQTFNNRVPQKLNGRIVAQGGAAKQ